MGPVDDFAKAPLQSQLGLCWWVISYDYNGTIGPKRHSYLSRYLTNATSGLIKKKEWSATNLAHGNSWF